MPACLQIHRRIMLKEKADSAPSLRASFMLSRGVVGCRLCQVPDLRLCNNWTGATGRSSASCLRDARA